MKKTAIKVASDQELIARYELLASERGRALGANNSKSANKAFDEEDAIRRELESREPSAIRLLLPLLTSSDPWVRLDSAVPTLFFEPREAEPVLEQLAKEPKSLGFTAEMTLKQWRRGELKAWWRESKQRQVAT